jgi:collagen type VI alpha
MTNLYSALSRIRADLLTKENGNRPEVQDIMIMLTDGRSNVNTRLTTSEARQLKAGGLTIAGIAIKMTDFRELKTVVSEPTDRFLITVDDFEDLAELGPRLAYGLCRGNV